MNDVSPITTIHHGAHPPQRPRRPRPELVGVPAIDAHDHALDAGLLAVAENATHTAGGRSRVDRQDPDAGAEMEHGAIVRIWIGT